MKQIIRLLKALTITLFLFPFTFIIAAFLSDVYLTVKEFLEYIPDTTIAIACFSIGIILLFYIVYSFMNERE